MTTKSKFCICQATGAFGRLSSRAFKNHNIKLHTKISVYPAVVISVLLYGSEARTPYRRHIKTLELFHMNSLHKILGISWQDKVPHTEVLKRTSCISLENTINPSLLRGLGHPQPTPSMVNLPMGGGRRRAAQTVQGPCQ